MVMTAEQRQLAEDNHSLIYKVLHDMQLSDEEFYGTAAIGLCKAAMTYQADKYRFSTYACRCIYNEIKADQRIAYYLKRRQDGRWLSYNDLSPEGTELIETFESGVDPERDAIIRVMAQQVVRKLRPRERQIVLFLVSGKSRREVAERMKISRQRVGQILDGAKDRAIRSFKWEE